MLQEGIIEESTSPCSSPIVAVLKPNGSFRICNNFQRLNQVSEFDSYPLHQVDDLVEHLGRAKFISTFDLTKGYWQVAKFHNVHPKTAFSTISGQWQYRVLPLGLHGAPATFQWLMVIILCHPLPICSRLSGHCHPLQHLGGPSTPSQGGSV